MIEEKFPDDERRLLLDLAINAVPKGHPPSAKLLQVISRLSGTDTILVAHRAYPSRKGITPSA